MNSADQSRMITVAIHTLNRATELKTLLEREGIEVCLQNVNLSNPVMSAGVRVRISESDLPLALRIIENPEIFQIDDIDASIKSDRVILVPVDFTEKTLHAAKVACAIAATLNSKIVLLHSFLVPHTNPLTGIGVSLNVGDSSGDIEDAVTAVEIAKIARDKMRRLEHDLRSEIKHGNLPVVKYSSVLLEGVPEECIGRYVKEHPEVSLLVMGTRAAEKKSADMAGSITAEVLDSCRVQTLTVPEQNTQFVSLESVKRVALVSHMEQEDFLALDALHRILPKEQTDVAVNIVCMPNDRYSRATNDAARDALKVYFKEHFPTYEFTITVHDKANPKLETGNVDLIVVPSRKKNILARLFNPGAAHRILFHTDVALLVIPV